MSSDRPAELILGTAQFGDAYGATNTAGRLSEEQVASVLSAATGVALLDTSPEYGDAQERLGRLAPPGTRYVTKFTLPAAGPVDEGSVFGDSMTALRVKHLEGVLFHRLADFDDPRAARAVEVLRAARAEGVIGGAGASVYDIDDVRAALRVFPDLDLLQVPGNVLDRRLVDHPLVAELRARGLRVHVRSAFLQGVLLTSPDALPAHFEGLRPAIAAIGDAARSSGQTPAGVLLRFLREHPQVDGVVVGALADHEMAQIVDEWASAAQVPALDLPDAGTMIDPRSWPPAGGSGAAQTGHRRS